MLKWKELNIFQLELEHLDNNLIAKRFFFGKGFLPYRSKLMKKLRFVESETSLIAQLWGKNPENFRKTAEQIVDGTFAKELGLPDGVNFVGIDLNMGCPAKSEVQNGACSALILNRELAGEIITATQEGAAGKIPVSVKTRLGYNTIDHTWAEFLLGFDLDMLTIHGRTKKEMSKVPAHWDEIGKVRELRDQLAPRTLIVGNGDVLTKQQGLDLAVEHSLDGIMIGRGIFHDPYVFTTESEWEQIDTEERLKLYLRHVEKFAETWQNNERPIHTLNKFCKIYINGFDGAKELREQLMAADSSDALIEILHASLNNVVLSPQ